MEGKMEGIKLLFGRLMQKAIQAGGDLFALGKTVALEALLTRPPGRPQRVVHWRQGHLLLLISCLGFFLSTGEHHSDARRSEMLLCP